jgi:glycosyltransferase involved in cell wall biosynthesis/GT2 family glycosyltransferase
MPFAGDARAAEAALRSLTAITIGEREQAIIVDNAEGGRVAELATAFPGRIDVIEAPVERSSYHARNVGAEAARGEWLLFIDADCVPPADLVARYLADPVADDVGMLAGPIVGARGQDGLLTEWARTRHILSQARSLDAEAPAAATANVLVRRTAWEQVGGFHERIRSGGDHEFSWRIADAGWRIEARPEAAVEHLHRTSLRGVARQMARYAAGNTWQRRRRPEAAPSHGIARPAARAMLGAPFFAVTFRPRRAVLKLVDLVATLSQLAGGLAGNSIRSRPSPQPDRIVIATDRFPVRSETFVTGEIEALRGLGRSVRVEAVARPEAPANAEARGLEVHYAEDESVLGSLAAAVWAYARHPLASLRDRALRKLYPDEWLPFRSIAPIARRLAQGRERHVHVHFAALAAVNSIRAARLAGCRVSIAAHGHDVFKTPRALESKLRAAEFATAPCEYTGRYLRAMSPETRVEMVVMGIDGSRLVRRSPYPGSRTVLGVGRLVEKKGFADLVKAAALLEADAPLDEVLIIGDGPLREELEALIDATGMRHRITLRGSAPHDATLESMERADLLAMPCIVAADGDRDAMPVVVKEALAYGVPVVGTDEVGLPEVVKKDWGRLVPPGDAGALAAAIKELLALAPAIRERMGASGREFVIREFDQRRQAQRLLSHIDACEATSSCSDSEDS